MNITEYIKAMPKAEINIRLDGYFRSDTILTIAEQNDIPSTIKRFKPWIETLANPEFSRAEEIIQTVSQWLQIPDDLTRLVYEMAVDLSKQNIKYAEVLVNPVTHMIEGMTFEEFLNAINDGRDRAKRGWGIELAWVLVVPRTEPRRADEIARWATSATAKKGGVVGFGLIGKESIQPVGQFERAFNSATKKDVPRVAQAGNVAGAEGVLQTLKSLEPNRVTDGWGAIGSPEVLNILSDMQIPLVVNLTGALNNRWVKNLEDYPLHQLYSENIKLVLSCDMPTFYHSNLTEQYQIAVEKCGLSMDELHELVINSLEVSWMPEDEKALMISNFLEDFARLHMEMASTSVEGE